MDLTWGRITGLHVHFFQTEIINGFECEATFVGMFQPCHSSKILPITGVTRKTEIGFYALIMQIDGETYRKQVTLVYDLKNEDYVLV